MQATPGHLEYLVYRLYAQKCSKIVSLLKLGQGKTKLNWGQFLSFPGLGGVFISWLFFLLPLPVDAFKLFFSGFFHKTINEWKHFHLQGDAGVIEAKNHY